MERVSAPQHLFSLKLLTSTRSVSFAIITSIPNNLGAFETPPPPHQLEPFFTYLARCSKGQVQRKPSIPYLSKLWLLVRQMVKHKANYEYSRPDKGRVQQVGNLIMLSVHG
jgi:hypothetical protein